MYLLFMLRPLHDFHLEIVKLLDKAVVSYRKSGRLFVGKGGRANSYQE